MKKFLHKHMILVVCLLAVGLSACAAPETEETGTQSAAAVVSEAAEADFIYEETQDGQIILTAYTGSDAEPVIPAEINGKAVTAIGDGCFQGLLGVRKIHIPEGITAIGDYAFECCSALEKVYFPSSLKEIGNGAFSGCNHLTLADMQDGITSIGTGAFLGCDALVYLELPADLQNLGDFAFALCGQLARVKFRGDAVAVLPDRLFYACPALTWCSVPESIVSVGKRAFSGCEALQRLWFSNPLERVSEYAFEGCAALQNINFPVKAIEKGTFSGCHTLQSLTLAENTESIAERAFAGTGITRLDIPESVSRIEEGAFAGSAVRAVSMPEDSSLYRIIDGSLYTDGGKTLLAYFPADPYGEEEQVEFTVPEGVEIIAAEAFYGSPLEKITLPRSLKEIHARAFSYSRIEELDIPAGTETDPTALQDSVLAAPEQEEPAGEEAAAPAEERKAGSAAPEKSLFREEDFRDYLVITNEEYDAWSEKYVAYNRAEGILETRYMPYIMMYKGEVVPHYLAMTAVQNRDPEMWSQAAMNFGDDFERLYLMMDHGLFTELSRGKMCDNLVLYSGLYDSQICAAAGTETLPTTKELVNAIGSTFTDPIMISTTTDPRVAANFGDTLFIIYASKEAMEDLGAVSIDSVQQSFEKEILMNANARYRVLDVGTMEIEDGSAEEPAVLYRNYIRVELLGAAE